MTDRLDTESLSYKKIFMLWVPLAAMWLVMGIEQPMINAVMARMDEVKKNLAAFGITFSIALILEAPIIQLLAAATALADSKNNYRRLLMFMHILGGGMIFFHLLIGLTPIYTLLLKNVLGVPEELISLSRRAFLWMTPWGTAVGYRRLWQGILIRYERTDVIPITMISRLTITAAVLFTGLFLKILPGAELGGFASSCGVIIGAAASYLFYLPIKKEFRQGGDTISWKELIQFYFPLALTNFFTFIVRPFISFGLARAAFPLESLAVWQVVQSIMFLFRSMSMAYQEVVVSLLKNSRLFHLLSRFAICLGLILTGGMLLIALSPAGSMIYSRIGGLNNDLMIFTRIPTIIVAFIPALTAMISWYRGLLIFGHRTGAIANATLVNSIILVLIMILVPMKSDVPGAIIAAGAFTFSMAVEMVYLFYKAEKLKKNILEN